MTSALKLHDTVMKVSDEAKALVPEVPRIKIESKLLSELVLCILSSQEKYEVALSVMKELKKNNALRIPKTKSELRLFSKYISLILSEPVKFKHNGKEYKRRIRFFIKKANYIVETVENIYLNNLTIGKILANQTGKHETRDNIIAYANGLGPKQASMFLRNIGYHSDFAVLDKHVIDYMRLMGLTLETDNSFSSLRVYQKIEAELKLYADTFKVGLLHLDLAIWTTMRTLKNYN